MEYLFALQYNLIIFDSCWVKSRKFRISQNVGEIQIKFLKMQNWRFRENSETNIFPATLLPSVYHNVEY